MGYSRSRPVRVPGSGCCIVCGVHRSKLTGMGRCKACFDAYHERQQIMADRRAVADACRSLTKALTDAKREREPAALPGIINSFLQKVGGTEEMANILKEDFDRLRGVGLTEEEFMKHEFKEQTIQRYWQMLLRGVAARDEVVSSVDLQGFSDEELRSVLIPLAAEMMVEDAEFRSQVIREAVMRDPKVLDDLTQEKSRVIDSQCTPVVKPAKKSAPASLVRVEEDVDPAELTGDDQE